MNEAETIHLVAAANEAYAAPLCVSVRSALDHLREGARIELHVLADGVSSETRARLEAFWGDRLEVEWIVPDNEAIAALVPDCGYAAAPATYYRLLMGSVLDPALDKVIYLDVDTVVLGDLCELWELDMGHHVVLAVQDACIQFLPPALVDPTDEQPIERALPYFNSGVMVVDLRAWRRVGAEITARGLATSDRIRRKFYEQDALNVSLAGRWGAISPDWNRQFSIDLLGDWRCSPYSEIDFERALTAPKIVHFCTETKPWQRVCDHPAEYTEIFRALLDEAGWSEDLDAPLSRAETLREFFASAHRAVLHRLAIVARARNRRLAALSVFPQILRLSLSRPWVLISVPVRAAMEGRLAWRS